MIGRKQRANSKYLTLRWGGYSLTATVLMAFLCVPIWAHAWTEPSSLPTQYSGTTPNLNFLNASTLDQQKIGSLIIGLGGDSASLCLNSDLSHGTSDPGKCISSWTQISPDSSNSVPLGAVPATPSNINNYAATRTGFIHIWGNDQAHPATASPILYSLLADANPNVPGGVGLVAADHGLALTGDFSYNYAGYFLGKTVIGNASPDRYFCLNDSFAYGPGLQTGCIKKWTDIIYPSNGVAHTTLFPATGQPTPEAGQINVGGPASFGGIIAGSTSGLPVNFTCGDGQCQSTETAGSCSIDCGSIATISTFSAWPGDGKVYFDAAVPGAGVLGSEAPWYVVVLKKSGSAPTARPQDGVFYAAGQTIGDSTVAYANPADTPLQPTQNFLDSTPDSAPNGIKMYYAAYLANVYPRYGQAAVSSATPNRPTARLTLVMNFPNAGVVTAGPAGSDPISDISQPPHGEGPILNCGNTQNPTCTGLYTVGTDIRVAAEQLLAQYHLISMNGGSVCTTTQSTCGFLITTDTTVYLTFAQNSFGGGGGTKTITGG